MVKEYKKSGFVPGGKVLKTLMSRSWKSIRKVDELEVKEYEKGL